MEVKQARFWASSAFRSRRRGPGTTGGGPSGHHAGDRRGRAYHLGADVTRERHAGGSRARVGWAGAAAALCVVTAGCAAHAGGAIRADAAQTRVASAYAYARFIEAELEAARGHLDAASAQYRAALTASDAPYLWARLAKTELARGRLDAASTDADHALTLDPRSAAGWLARAAIAEARAR
ncbi:MAG: hypothetical protein KC543_00375, partial [Myxococcales bacterium]|nr:hypothetical protein [Myxococcales bacterium]